MLGRVDVTVAALEVAPSEYMEKEICGIPVKLDCSAFYLHDISFTRQYISTKWAVLPIGIRWIQIKPLEKG